MSENQENHLTARVALYLIVNRPLRNPGEDSSLGAVATFYMGVALAHAHPEYTAAILAELPSELKEQAKEATDEFLKAVPLDIREDRLAQFMEKLNDELQDNDQT